MRKTKFLIFLIAAALLVLGGLYFFRDEESSGSYVSLYFYNASKDTDGEGQILCSRKGIVPVKRNVPDFPGETESRIQSAVQTLLRGQLTDEDKAAGISTEFPLSGLEIAEVEFDGGIATLRFNDPENKTVGGACRVGILWYQIEQTVLQFPEVKEVRFEPEFLFQP